jgi:MFS family permease
LRELQKNSGNSARSQKAHNAEACGFGIDSFRAFVRQSVRTATYLSDIARMDKPIRTNTQGGRTPLLSLIGCTCCILLGPAVLAFYTFTLFMTPLASELRVGRGLLSLSITVGTLATAFSSPMIGRWIDRRGGRATLIPASIALSLVMAALAFAAGHLVSLFTLFALIGVLCSAFYIAVPRIIASLFDRRRGVALGVTMSGTGLGAIVLMPLVQFLIQRWDWHVAYLSLAGLVLCISVPSAILLVSDQPAARKEVDRAPAGAPVGRSDARRTLNFALLAGSYLLIGVGLDGIVIHFVPILVSQHLSTVTAAAMFSAAGVAIVVGRVICGLLMDRMPAHWIGMTVFLLSSIGVLLLHVSATPLEYYSASALFGLGVGAEMDILGYLVSRLFPMEVFARIYGLIYGAFMVGTSIGPPLFGSLYDRQGDYVLVIWLAASVVAIAAIALAFIQNPTARDAAWQRKGLVPGVTL